jgi:Ca-activated chloride channel family protein
MSFVLSLLLSFAFASDLDSVFSNQSGVQDLEKSNPAAATQKFIEALANSPYDARLHLNLGLSFELVGQADKAQAAYETAAKLTEDPEVRFVANFNHAQLLQKAKKKDEALGFYEKALADKPDSNETKVNIELLLQDQQGGGEGKDEQENKDKDKKNEGESDKEKENEKEKEGQDKPKDYGKGNKPQPPKFKSEDLTQGDVNKILGEIKQQEQKIRAEFNKKDAKDKPKDKDW